MRRCTAALLLGTAIASCNSGPKPTAQASSQPSQAATGSNQQDAANVEAPIGDVFAHAGPNGVPAKYTPGMAVPMDSRASFVQWAVSQRGETEQYAGARWDRFQALLANRDITDDAGKKAYLLTPREAFALPQNLKRAYEHAFLDIGYGVTISGPHAVARMTTALQVQPSDKVLEIGTGSGYQSAYLSHLTDKVWSIEIIRPLSLRTQAIYNKLAEHGYSEFANIQTKNADGYFGWPEAGPFDKIIVTCGIDHIPPPLLQQLKPGGIMVIPVGPPGAQHVLKVVKAVGPDGKITITRSDIFNGKVAPFVPFTKLEGASIVGTHNQ